MRLTGASVSGYLTLVKGHLRLSNGRVEFVNTPWWSPIKENFFNSLPIRTFC